MSDSIFILTIVAVILLITLILNFFLVYMPIWDASSKLEEIDNRIDQLIERFGPPLEAFLKPILADI